AVRYLKTQRFQLAQQVFLVNQIGVHHDAILLQGTVSWFDSRRGTGWRQGRFVAMAAIPMNRSFSANLREGRVGTLDSAGFTTVWSPSRNGSSTVPSTPILSRLDRGFCCL